MEPYKLSLSEMIGQIKRRKLSPVALMESLLQRIDALEPSLQAWVTIDRGAVLEEARRQEKEIARGKTRGPLHGIPIGVKDIFYTAGLKTTGGSKIFENFIPDYDATSVARLKKAGAIVLGKTATTEFAYADPAPTRNPWNLEHTPGGSSSGSAAAVATCMCPAALGTQTAGSVLRPAAYCGVVGTKPTYGRISRYGVFPLGYTLDHVGFLTRTVEDAAILLGVLAGSDPHDPTASPEPVPDYLRSCRSLRRPPRIGIIREYYQEKSEEQVWRHTEKVLMQLKKAGAPVEEVKMPPSFAAVQDAQRVIMRVEGASFHQNLLEKHRDLYRPKLRELVEIGLLIPAWITCAPRRLNASSATRWIGCWNASIVYSLPRSHRPPLRASPPRVTPISRHPGASPAFRPSACPQALPLKDYPWASSWWGRPLRREDYWPQPAGAKKYSRSPLSLPSGKRLISKKGDETLE